ncbi:hypothetical protein [Acidithiobacillus marinus]|nr:hypothetical protein [Acidithiobacillus marinus]
MPGYISIMSMTFSGIATAGITIVALGILANPTAAQAETATPITNSLSTQLHIADLPYSFLREVEGIERDRGTTWTANAVKEAYRPMMRYPGYGITAPFRIRPGHQSNAIETAALVALSMHAPVTAETIVAILPSSAANTSWAYAINHTAYKRIQSAENRKITKKWIKKVEMMYDSLLSEGETKGAIALSTLAVSAETHDRIAYALYRGYLSSMNEGLQNGKPITTQIKSQIESDEKTIAEIWRAE